MKWEKKGLIYCPDGSKGWATSSAMIPTPRLISEDRLRIFCSFCDESGIGRVGYIDVQPDDPSRVLAVSPKPLFEIGEPGTFDDNGAVVCSVVDGLDNNLLMFYVGFELCHKVRYRLFTGLAISDDGGTTFHKYSKCPVLDHTDDELLFRCGPFCMYEHGLYRLWYVAGSDWTIVDGKSMPVYTIRYLESSDGIRWGKKGTTCIDITSEEEHGFGRPYVISHDGIYKMFYSIRVKQKGYRLGYAESHDGISWTRMDDRLNLDVSPEGWDSKMICYSAVFSSAGKTYLFYNGNGFGNSGVGYAQLESW